MWTSPGAILLLALVQSTHSQSEMLRGKGPLTPPPLLHHSLHNIALPSNIYERTANSANYGRRMYPTQEDAGSWDELREPAEARGGDIGFTVTGDNLEADLPIDERLPAEESF